MKNKTKKTLTIFHKILILAFVIVIITAAYTLIDNNRVVVIEQVVEIKNLPTSFDGYKILVLSDLHGKRFGEKQANLVNLINSLEYDALLLAGDFQFSEPEELQPLFEIVDGLDSTSPVYFVAGNWDYHVFDTMTGQIERNGKLIQAHGIEILTTPQQIQRGSDHFWLVPYFSYNLNQEIEKMVSTHLATSTDNEERQRNQQILDYQSSLLQTIRSIHDDEIQIGLMHIPLTKEELDDLSDFPKYDLVLAGHYHGGQIRIPLIGALYVPDHYSPKSGFLPDNKFISGLYTGKKSQQFISRGLGATSVVPWLKFRFFNSPEIDLITLK